MRRPLMWTVCAILIVASVTYSPADACKKGSRTPEADATAAAERPIADEAAMDSACAAEPAKTESAIETVRSALRAGGAVGRAVATTAVVVASSVACAARHAAMALVRSAYSLV